MKRPSFILTALALLALWRTIGIQPGGALGSM